MAKSKKTNTKGITISAMLLALSVITLYSQTLFPVANFTLYMISSFYTAFVIIESGARAGWVFYLASAIFGFIFVPDKVFIIPYILFFGLYGLLKFYIEKLKKLPIEYVLKLLCFNISLGIIAVFFQEMVLGSIKLPDFPIFFIIIALEFAFIAYDYLFTMMIGFYMRRIKVNK